MSSPSIEKQANEIEKSNKRKYFLREVIRKGIPFSVHFFQLFV